MKAKKRLNRVKGLVYLMFFIFVYATVWAQDPKPRAYVGSDVCQGKCFECHTTGYKEPGGFRSEHETPHLKNAGCEVCHGPGSLHVETGEPKDIKGSLTAEDCDVCHSSERVEAFDYKPLIHGGAH